MVKAEFSWPVLGVIIPSLLIAGCGYGIYFFLLVPYHTSKFQLVWFQFCISMTWFSYYLAITTNPGKPAKDYEPKEGEWRRWCVKCNAWKPERTHHCKQCKQCVLQMDHHCPWTYNCVGHNNLPHFIRFLLWVDITSGYGFYQVVLRAIDLYRSRNLPAYMIPTSQIVATIVLAPVVFFVLFTVSLLTLRVFINLFNGQTQIEAWEIERVETLVRHRLVRNVDFPYDIDPFVNIVNGWGHPVTWFWPFGHAPGDGMHFEKNEAADGGAVWPPDHVDQNPPDPNADLHGQMDPTYTTMTTYTRAMHSSSSRSRSRTPSGSDVPDVPEWRRNFTSESDFYRPDQWENYEGERLEDFGVDVDTIGPRPVTRIPRDRSQHNQRYERYEHNDDERNDDYDSVDEEEDPSENIPLSRYVR